MRRQSVKHAAMCKEMKADRQRFLEECATCVLCRTLPSEDCHEILAGAHRLSAFKERACWLGLCRECHDLVQGEPVPFQLALKILQDPAHFSILRVCEVWGRAPTAVTAEEVLLEVQKILVARWNATH